MVFALVAAFVGALLAPALHRRLGDATAWLLSALSAALFAYFALHLPAVAAGETVRHAHEWVPALDVRLTFVLDGLSLLFALLITGLGALILAYTGPYLGAHRDRGRFFLSFVLFEAAMLGLVLADNLITLFVFWELTSFSSFLLIGFDHERERPRKNALQALLVTAGGGLALLAGFILLGVVGGSFELSELTGRGEAVRVHALYLPILLLVAAGAFTKSAQFPFHFWLPNAMEAPTPVSAYLHSATMVKAGVYLLARTNPLLGGTPEWTWLLASFGAVTMVLGAVLALRQTDLKLVLAYSTVFALGTLVLLIGFSVEASLTAAMVFLLVHALYKAALFLTSGAVDHEAGTRDVLRLGGLRHAMPITAAAAVVAGLSMAGLPPFFGFIGKELAYEAALGFEEIGYLFPILGVVANAATLVAAGLVVLKPFFGPAVETPKAAHEAPFGMWLGPAVCAAGGVAFGVLPGLVDEPLLGPAASAVAGRDVPVQLYLWHGIEMPLILSALTVAAGVALYPAWDRVRGWLARTDRLASLAGPERGYERALDGTVALARFQTRVIQSGSLRAYVHLLVLALAGLAAATLLAFRLDLGAALRAPEAVYYEWILALLVGAACVCAALARSRLVAVASLGVAGFGIALLYLVMGAPDLAMTQFLVETLTVVVILLVLHRLPRFRDTETQLPSPSPWRDGLVAVGAGAVVTVLVLMATAVPFDARITDYFLSQSYPAAHGRNVVNVVLVDFRALDTLGEITVLAGAGLGVYALVRLGAHVSGQGVLAPRILILRTATRLLIALLLLYSLFLLWRGHNEPGGGFIGGLVAAGAFTLYGIAFGWRAMRSLLRVSPRFLMAAGLGLGILAGLLALVVRAPFLTGVWLFLGEPGQDFFLELGSPLIFDVGVFLVVIGFVLTVVLALERSAAAAAAEG